MLSSRLLRSLPEGDCKYYHHSLASCSQLQPSIFSRCDSIELSHSCQPYVTLLRFGPLLLVGTSLIPSDHLSKYVSTTATIGVFFLIEMLQWSTVVVKHLLPCDTNFLYWGFTLQHEETMQCSGVMKLSSKQVLTASALQHCAPKISGVIARHRKSIHPQGFYPHLEVITSKH